MVSESDSRDPIKPHELYKLIFFRMKLHFFTFAIYHDWVKPFKIPQNPITHIETVLDSCRGTQGTHGS